MYGGTPRAKGATFLLDQGGKVSHFNYFGNERTAERDRRRADRRRSRAGSGGSARCRGPASRRRARAPRCGAPASRGRSEPAVFILPGILGSNLDVDGKRSGSAGASSTACPRCATPRARRTVSSPTARSACSTTTSPAFLSATHEVIEFAYDWRRPIEDEARRLAEAVDGGARRAQADGQPVRLLAHSMGGLVARTMQLEAPERVDAHDGASGARLLMLGTPNGGSWAPMQVLSGDDTFGNLLVASARRSRAAKTRQLMARVPGLHAAAGGLLDEAPASSAEPLAAARRRRPARACATKARGTTSASSSTRTPGASRRRRVLDSAVELRRRSSTSSATRPADASATSCCSSSGTAPLHARRLSSSASEGVVYLDAADAGDGRVTLQSAMLPGVRTWTLDCEHGELPEEAEAFEAYLELLTTGTTELCRRCRSRGVRGAARSWPARRRRAVRSRPSRAADHARAAAPTE